MSPDLIIRMMERLLEENKFTKLEKDSYSNLPVSVSVLNQNISIANSNVGLANSSIFLRERTNQNYFDYGAEEASKYEPTNMNNGLKNLAETKSGFSFKNNRVTPKFSF